MKNKNYLFLTIVSLCWLICGTAAVSAQTSEFTYQGKLNDNSAAANGSYDLEFRLFDAASGSSALAVQQQMSVAVTDGVFAVQLDFGASSFNGSARYIEVAVKPAGGGSFTTMAPRQPISSTPYAVRSLTAATADTALNASQLGGVSSGTFVQTTDPRLTDARPPTAGSGSYIQNTNSVQPFSNFNVSGNGTVGSILTGYVVNTPNQYNIGGNRIVSAPGTGNTFVGFAAGNANAAGGYNSFFGAGAGQNTTGGSGHDNAFFGANSGNANVGGGSNAFFGTGSGLTNTTGSGNAFFGERSGNANIGGGDNAFFGHASGVSNTDGGSNAFFGPGAGLSNTIGSFNTMIGFEANVGSNNLANATAIGANAQVNTPNSLVLGSINGVNNATADTNVGIGTTTPNARLHIAANGGNILMGNAGCSSGYVGVGFGSSLSGCTNYSMIGNGNNTIINRPTGGSIIFRENNVTQMTIGAGGTVSISNLAIAGITQLCVNGINNQISYCSSSLRYKKDLQPFTRGLALLDQLKPITFKWKQNDLSDLGFGAEDVAKVEPLLVTHNEKGEVEGVKYDRISAVLVNAVKEQQTQIETLQKQLEQQQALTEGLKKLVCQNNTQAKVCK